MQLNFKKVGEGEPLIILHGLFGSLDNWMTFAKKLGEDFEVYIVDARNHGQSPHSDQINYDIMADDLYEFLLQNAIVDPIILGHSMGGKTAMQFAMNYPNHIAKLIVADIAPKSYSIRHRDIIDGLLSLDFSAVNTRKAAEEELGKYIDELSIRQFLLKNLYWKEKEQLAWRFNLTIIDQKIEMLAKEIENVKPFNKPTLFIRGEKSDYIADEDLNFIKTTFNNSEIKSINAGHWVHAENPTEFLQLLNSFLTQG